MPRLPRLPRLTRTLRRSVGGAALGALAVGAVPGLASAQVAPPVPTAESIDHFCAAAPGAPSFTDTAGSSFRAAISCVEAAGIARGVGDGTRFQPEGTVTRAQMASFVARLIDTANEHDPEDGLVDLPAVRGTGTFLDIGVGSPHRNAIDRLETVGIVRGGPAGAGRTTFGPDLPVTRGQMATFVANAFDYLVPGTPVPKLDFFVDDEGSVHEPGIDLVSNLGIAIGTGEGTFAPDEQLTREQMSAFLARTLAHLARTGEIEPLAAA